MLAPQSPISILPQFVPAATCTEGSSTGHGDGGNREEFRLQGTGGREGAAISSSKLLVPKRDGLHVWEVRRYSRRPRRASVFHRHKSVSPERVPWTMYLPLKVELRGILEAAYHILSLKSCHLLCEGWLFWSTRDSSQLDAWQRWAVSRDRALGRAPSSPEDGQTMSGQDGQIQKSDGVSLGKVSPC